MPDGMTKTRRTKLLGVEPEIIEPKKPKTLVLGAPGVGKTWVSLDFPSVYYIDTEGGADLNHYREKLKRSGGMYFGPEQGSLDIDVVIGQIQALGTERHTFRSVVFDSITKLWNTMLGDEQEKLGDSDGFGAYKKVPIRKMATLLRWVNRLDMNVMFISHSKELWGKNDKGQREAVGVTFDGWEKLAYELHLVLEIYKQGPSRRARIGKSRLIGFPETETFEWSYAAFAERYGKDVIEKAAQPLVIATEDQVAEIKRLLEVVKVPADYVEKVFKKAGVEDWSEMDADKIVKCIESLKEKLAS